MPSALLEHAVPEDVIEFASRRQLLPHLERAIRLAETAFHPVHRMTFEVETDPETGEQWVAVDVTVDTDGEDVLRRDWAYALEWVKTTPPDVRSWVRVLYHVM
jgi:hypothetical protein